MAVPLKEMQEERQHLVQSDAGLGAPCENTRRASTLPTERSCIVRDVPRLVEFVFAVGSMIQ